MSAHALAALLWVGFGAVHSLLAAEGVKARLAPLFGARLRLAYNLFAIVHLGAVLWLCQMLLADAPPAIALPAWVSAMQWAMVAAGAWVLWRALAGYDLGRFIGTAQARAAAAGAPIAEDEPLRTGGIHGRVRHPLYLGSILLVWGLVDNAFMLSTAFWVTVYFIVGIRFEEAKLMGLYGDAYRAYCRRVPMLIPRLWG